MNTKLNSIGTAEHTPQVHRSKDGLRGLCGVKVLPMSADKQTKVDQSTTCGELVAITGCEPCVDCNVEDKYNDSK